MTRPQEVIQLSLQPTIMNNATIVPATLEVGFDGDSSFIPSIWVDLTLTDADHDADSIRLTVAEAEALHDRLGDMLWRSGSEARK